MTDAEQHAVREEMWRDAMIQLGEDGDKLDVGTSPGVTTIPLRLIRPRQSGE